MTMKSKVAMLASKGRLLLEKPVQQWCLEALGAPGFQCQPLTPEIAVENGKKGFVKTLPI
jgi:PIN domain nuclease of toxin-antitoxin system